MDKQMSLSGLMNELTQARTNEERIFGEDGSTDTVGEMSG